MRVKPCEEVSSAKRTEIVSGGRAVVGTRVDVVGCGASKNAQTASLRFAVLSVTFHNRFERIAIVKKKSKSATRNKFERIDLQHENMKKSKHKNTKTRKHEHTKTPGKERNQNGTARIYNGTETGIST
jgi:hypothetical protein